MNRSTHAAAPSALSFAPSVSAERQTEIASFYGAYTRGEQPKARGLSLHGTRIIGDTPTGPVLRFVLFSEGRKRDGDEFMVSGADLSHIRANPRVTWSHKYDQLPVGNWIRIEPMVDVKLGPIIEADAVPLRVDDGSDAAKLSQTLFRMYAAHDLDAVSGGWIPRKIEAIVDTDGRTLGLRHLDSEVLEGAFVLIGADAQALQRAVQARRLPEEHVPFFVRERGSAIYTVRDMAEIPPSAPAAEPTSVADLIAQARASMGAATDLGSEAHDTGHAKTASVRAAADEPPADAEFQVGDRVTVKPGAEHDAMTRGKTGVIVEISTPAYGIQFDGMDGVHKWYVRDEVQAADGADDGVRAAPDATAVRWNPALGRAFDTTTVEYTPSTAEIDLAARFLECRVRDLVANGTRVPSCRMGSFLSALDEALASYDTHDVRNLDPCDGTEKPPVYERLQLNSTRWATFLIEGTRFLAHGADRLTLRVQPRWYGLEVRTYRHRDHGGVDEVILERAWTRARQLNFLKGEAFALSGQFLERTAETWGDLFLEPENIGPLQRVAELLNKQGGALPNRGLIAMGPPGTGKTLAGRILMNSARATFLWVSARDLYYAGAFEGIADAFALARECAPAILFLEDIDNFLGNHSHDLLKTEMDGIGRSSGVVTILTTNYPERLPEALLDRPGRFHDVLRLELPTAEMRGRMLAKWMPDLDEAGRAAAVAATEGYSGAHVRELAHFVQVLRAEDGLALGDALTRALSKLQEQRDLITEVQLAPGRYRMAPALELATRALPALARPGVAAALETRAFSVAGADQVADEVLARLRRELPALTHGRAGAVLAKRNLDRLAQARQHFTDGAALIDQVLADATRAKGDPLADDEDEQDEHPAPAEARAAETPAPVLGPDLDRMKRRLAREREDDAAVSELGSVMAGMRRRLKASREEHAATR